jgi:hypothetical protein
MKKILLMIILLNISALEARAGFDQGAIGSSAKYPLVATSNTLTIPPGAVYPFSVNVAASNFAMFGTKIEIQKNNGTPYTIYSNPGSCDNKTVMVSPIMFSILDYWGDSSASGSYKLYIRSCADGCCPQASLGPGKPEGWSIEFQVPVNGACGSANGQKFTTAPTSDLCTTGIQTTVSGSGPWSWNCVGSSGGSTASCSADIKKKTAP